MSVAGLVLATTPIKVTGITVSLPQVEDNTEVRKYTSIDDGMRTVKEDFKLWTIIAEKGSLPYLQDMSTALWRVQIEGWLIFTKKYERCFPSLTKGDVEVKSTRIKIFNTGDKNLGLGVGFTGTTYSVAGNGIPPWAWMDDTFPLRWVKPNEFGGGGTLRIALPGILV